MTKIDFKKLHKDWYKPSSKNVSAVNVPAMNFLMIDGKGSPDKNPSFTSAIEALFAVSFGLKFMFKKQPAPKGFFEYVVPPLEGLWWMPDNNPGFWVERKEEWLWTLMIMQPDFFTQEMVAGMIEKIKTKKGLDILDQMRFESFDEGKAVQILHVGPYSEEGPNIQKMHDFVAQEGWSLTGKHHEIYLGDPRRAAPEKLRTILRHPVKEK